MTAEPPRLGLDAAHDKIEGTVNWAVRYPWIIVLVKELVPVDNMFFDVVLLICHGKPSPHVKHHRGGPESHLSRAAELK